ncbi:unnamed protein product, partial [Brassica rapa subsp. trilocularis]
VRRRTKFKDWSDFKLQLLERFGHVRSCSSVAVKLKDESSCSSEAVPEIKLVKKTASPTEEDVSAELETEETSPYVADSLCEIDQTACLRCEHEAIEIVQNTDSLKPFGSVKECSPRVVMVTQTEREKDKFHATDQEEELVQEKDESTLINEAVRETELVGKLNSPLVEAIDMKAYEETEEMVPQDSLNALEQQTGLFLRHDFVKENYSSAPVLEEIDSVQFLRETVIIDEENLEIACVSRLCGHRLRRVPIKKRQRKGLKTWKFKYKPLSLLRIMLQMNSKQVTDERKHKELLTVKRRQDSKYGRQLFLGVLTYHVNHKWRVKHFTPVSDSEGCVDQLVDENDATKSVLVRRMLARLDERHLRWWLELGGSC